MRYSLLGRFRGAVAGVSFGSRLMLSRQKSFSSSVDSRGKANQNSYILLKLEQCGLKGCESETEDEHLTSTDEESLVVQMTRSLIRCQGFERANWNQSWQKWQQDQQRRSALRSNRVEEQSKGVRTRSKFYGDSRLSPAKVAVATLPIALFFHEQPDRLRQQLRQGIQIWPEQAGDEVLEQAVFALHLAIALALKEELDPPTVIPTILNHLDPQIDLYRQLQQVQTLTEQNVSLETAQEILLKSSREFAMSPTTAQAGIGSEDTTSIALAFYGFVSTAHDPDIALLRSVEMGLKTPMVSTLTGALSGAYNSFSSFPLSWQLQLQTATNSSSPIVSPAAQAPGGKPLLPDILQSATELFSVWSGVYNTASSKKFEIDPTLTVAAPNVIRSHQS